MAVMSSSTTISIPDQIQIVGEPGSFYTIVSLDSLGPDTAMLQNSRIVLEDACSENEKVEDPVEEEEEEGDILVCGKCKAHYSDINVFLQHKKSCKKDTLAKKVETENMAEEDEDQEDVYYAVESGVLDSEAGGLTQIYLTSSSQLLPLEKPQEHMQTKVKPAKEVEEPKQDENSTAEKKTLPKMEEHRESSTDQADSQDTSKSKKLFCSYCQKGFNKVFDLTQHTRSHTGEKPYQCVICGRGFAQKSNVKKHMATHKVWPKGHNTLPKEVAVTNEEDADDGGSHEGVALVRTVEATGEQKEQISVSNCYECPYCTITSSTYPSFKTHLRQHQTEKCYRCIAPNCSKMFQDLEQFLEHTQEHKDRQFRCHLCSAKFTDLGQLNLHSYSHLTDEQTREKQVFQCGKCKNRYTSAEALDHHLQTTPHSYTCELCDKEFTAERFLRKHLVITHSKGVFECEVCHKKLKNEHYLKSHSLIHTGEMPFECKVCGNKFNRKDKLKRHAQTHNASRKYKCPFKDHMNCTKEFHRFDKLKLHIMTHGNIKPFKCEICSNGFSRKEHLNAHIQKIHHGGKSNLDCNTCNEKFDNFISLANHIKEKHNEGPTTANAARPGYDTDSLTFLDKSCDPSLMSIQETSNHFSDYQLPDHLEDSVSTTRKETAITPGIRLEQTFPKQEPDQMSNQFPGKEDSPVQSIVGSAASQAMEILYSESGHAILMPQTGPYQMNV